MAHQKRHDFESIYNDPLAFCINRSIYSLRSFIDGVNSKDMTDVADYLFDFEEWLMERFNHDRLAVGIPHLITHYAANDSYQAFDSFFKLLEEFKEEPLRYIFRKIKRNPYQYLPERSIESLIAYLQGMEHSQMGLMGKIDMSAFESWLSDYFEIEAPWHKLILLYSVDAFSAFEQCKKLYEEFSYTGSHASDSE